MTASSWINASEESRRADGSSRLKRRPGPRTLQRGAHHREHLAHLSLVVVGGRVPAIDDGHHVAAQHLQHPLPVDEHGSVLIQSDAQQPRVGGEGRQQPAHPSPLTEVLIDDDVLQQTEPGDQLDHPLAGGRITGVAGQTGPPGHEMRRDDRGAGAGAGHHHSLGIALPDTFHHQRPCQQRHQPGLVAAGDEDSSGVA